MTVGPTLFDHRIPRCVISTFPCCCQHRQYARAMKTRILLSELTFFRALPCILTGEGVSLVAYVLPALDRPCVDAGKRCGWRAKPCTNLASLGSLRSTVPSPAKPRRSPAPPCCCPAPKPRFPIMKLRPFGTARPPGQHVRGVGVGVKWVESGRSGA